MTGNPFGNAALTPDAPQVFTPAEVLAPSGPSPFSGLFQPTALPAQAPMPTPIAPVLPTAVAPTAPTAPPRPSGETSKSQWLALIPAVLAGIKDPALMGAALAGWTRGRDKAQARAETEWQHADRRAREKAEFEGRILEASNEFDNEADRAAWLRTIEPTASYYGIDLTQMPAVSGEKAGQKFRASVADALKVAVAKNGPEILHADAGVALHLEGGRSIPMSQALELVGGYVTKDGALVVPKPAPPKLEKIEVELADGSRETRFVVPSADLAIPTGPAKQKEIPSLDDQLAAATAANNEAEIRRLIGVKGRIAAGGRAAPSGGGGAQAGAPTATTTELRQRERETSVLSDIRTISGMVSPRSVGVVGAKLAGSVLDVLNANQATDVAAAVESLKAKLGFAELEAMRAAARSGASGLGQITEKELSLLQSTIASLDTRQSVSQFKRALQAIESSIAAYGAKLELARQGVPINEIAEMDTQSLFLRAGRDPRQGAGVSAAPIQRETSTAASKTPRRIGRFELIP